LSPVASGSGSLAHWLFTGHYGTLPGMLTLRQIRAILCKSQVRRS
jgi:hypothetical protein